MKKQLIATLLAGAAGSSFAFAPTAALNHDPATYRNVTQKAAADYKSAVSKCNGMSGNDKNVCMAEAKAARAHTQAEALARYNNTAKGREKSRIQLADADYEVAKAKCGAKSGADKDDCLNNARSVHTAALADARSGRDSTAATGSSTTSTTVAGDARDQAAMDRCARLAGDEKTACLVDNKGHMTAAAATGAQVADRTEDAAAHAADKTRTAAATAAEKAKELARAAAEKTKEVASTVAHKTENAMEHAGEKTRAVASTAAAKTEHAMDHAGDKTREVASDAKQNTEHALDHAGDKTREMASDAKQNTEQALDRAGDKTRETASTAAHKTENAMDTAGEKTRDTAATVADRTERVTDHAGEKTARVASDSAITTKVKAFMFTEPALHSLAIHVKTEHGVVMLSGFVDSKASADKAVEVAKKVDGVTRVESAIKVK